MSPLGNLDGTVCLCGAFGKFRRGKFCHLSDARLAALE